MVTLSLVGCAHIHTPGFINTLKKRTDVKVKNVWDHDAARAKRRAEELGVPVIADVKSVWSDNEITGVIICSETDRHQPLVEAGAAAKKHLFVEKPLGMGSADGYAMANAIEKAGVKFQTGYFMRGDPKHVYLKQEIEAGHFGKITRIRGSNCHSGALGGWFDTEWRWMADPKVSGVGAFGDLGTHSLDIMLWLMGDVTAATAQIDNGTARYPGCDETGEGLMRFKNGAIGTLAAGWDDVTNPISLLISGTEGHAAIVHGQLLYQSKHVEGSDGKTPWAQLPGWKSAGFDAFLDAFVGKDVCLVSAREAAYRSAVMEAMYEGARGNKWVAPK